MGGTLQGPISEELRHGNAVHARFCFDHRPQKLHRAPNVTVTRLVLDTTSSAFDTYAGDGAYTVDQKGRAEKRVWIPGAHALKV